MNINEFSREIHRNAVEHGWWQGERNEAEVIALCHSELSEALEEYRDDKPLWYWYNADGEMCTDLSKHNGEKLEGIAVEMIDCIIRILDYCAALNVDVERLMTLKHEYNKNRPYKHGGKKI